jgi:CBS domain-containing protein
MLASQLIQSKYPSVDIQEDVSFALRMMNDYEMLHLPVLSEEKFFGMIDKDDLLDADEKATLLTLEYNIVKISVLPEEHFLLALKISTGFGLTIVPVVSKEKELLGIITQKDLLSAAGNFLGQDESGGIIEMEIEKRNYSFGELSRLVETNNAFITQLNTSTDSITGLLKVTIKVNKFEISDIISTLQRYDYRITFYYGEELFENELKENYDLLMTYLRI